jgi:hypothetical protein
MAYSPIFDIQEFAAQNDEAMAMLHAELQARISKTEKLRAQAPAEPHKRNRKSNG